MGGAEAVTSGVHPMYQSNSVFLAGDFSQTGEGGTRMPLPAASNAIRGRA